MGEANEVRVDCCYWINPKDRLNSIIITVMGLGLADIYSENQCLWMADGKAVISFGWQCGKTVFWAPYCKSDHLSVEI